MWQDGLALLIVVGAAGWLTRGSLSLALRRFRTDGKSDAEPVVGNGCNGCGSGSSCTLAHIKAQQAGLPVVKRTI